jgi:hypothetical protein
MPTNQDRYEFAQRELKETMREIEAAKQHLVDAIARHALAVVLASKVMEEMMEDEHAATH